MRKVLVTSLAGIGLVTGVVLAAPAMADPTDVYPAPLNGSGSDTTEIVMNELDAVNPDLGNWSVTGGNWDTNGPAAGCEFTTRTLGSTDGRRNLSNSVQLNDGCFQFARSSSRATSQATQAVAGTYTAAQLPNPAVTIQQVPIALAQDGLTYVFRAGSSTPRDLTLGQLRAIYSCTFTGSVDGRNLASGSIPNQPFIPTDASGSRADWLSLMGLPSSPAGSGVSEVVSDGGTLPACLDDGPGDTGVPGGEFAEHNGNVLTGPRQIILHSIAQYIAQGRSATGDTRGFALLGYIDGNVPLQQLNSPLQDLNPSTVTDADTTPPNEPVPNGDGAYFRTVYNNVPSGRADDADIIAVFGERQGPDNAPGGGDANDTSSSLISEPLQDFPITNSGDPDGVCNQDLLIQDNGFIPVC
jgi:hypothetical protein